MEIKSSPTGSDPPPNGNTPSTDPAPPSDQKEVNSLSQVDSNDPVDFLTVRHGHYYNRLNWILCSMNVWIKRSGFQMELTINVRFAIVMRYPNFITQYITVVHVTK